MSDYSKNLEGGKTEAPQAVSQTSQNTVSPNSDFTTHGATEAPQAVIRPEKPSSESGGGSEKSE